MSSEYRKVESITIYYTDGSSEVQADLFDVLPLIGQMLLNEHSRPKGFRDDPRSLDRELMLIASEVFEAFEDARTGKDVSDKIPEYSALEEEFADILIRVLESAAWQHDTYEGTPVAGAEEFTYRPFRIGDATRAKHAFNMTRPPKHGKRF